MTDIAHLTRHWMRQTDLGRGIRLSTKAIIDEIEALAPGAYTGNAPGAEEAPVRGKFSNER